MMKVRHRENKDNEVRQLERKKKKAQTKREGKARAGRRKVTTSLGEG